MRRTHFPFDLYPGKFKSVLCVIMIMRSSHHPHVGKGFAGGMILNDINSSISWMLQKKQLVSYATHTSELFIFNQVGQKCGGKDEEGELWECRITDNYSGVIPSLRYQQQIISN